MDAFPAVDPIPLPAPVYLFKLLHLVTLTLHFCAVHLFLGGILVATILAFLGGTKGKPAIRTSSGMMSYRLPIVMAYVVNLGIPPLLFAQVLYGRALYTSSVLIGVFWISVIFLVILSYYFAYLASMRAAAKKHWGIFALVSLLAALFVAFIYNNNMTLLARPELWVDMYRNSPNGVNLNAADPTVHPRWAYMILTSIAMAGVGMMLVGTKKLVDEDTGRFLRTTGARLGAIFSIAMLAAGFWVFSRQPQEIAEQVMANQWYKLSALLWAAGGVLLFLLTAVASFSGQKSNKLLAWGSALAGFLAVAGMTVFRDAIRDVTLGMHGYNVWDRTIETNWLIVGTFLVLFVAGVAGIGWMVWVVAKAKQVEEVYA
ncbi:hypothetical protein KQI84_07130 [bacterium]|nr:hypothetical protein [bacterium]